MENFIFCAVIVEIDVEQNTLFEMYIYVFLFSVTLSHKPTIENLRIKKLARIKKVGPRNTTEKNLCTDEIPMRKSFGPIKFPREKTWNPRNTYGGTMARRHYTHETHDCTGPMEFTTLVFY